MKTSAGLWIDYREAVIVMISDKGQEMARIRSNLREKSRLSHASREGDRSAQLATFYDEIIAGIRAAASVLIFGPGEAKSELRKRIERNTPAGRRLEMETSDKMTERQIVQKVRNHFNATTSSFTPTWDSTPPEDMNCEG
jgi:stalled ribosome rescue protein Dom34